MQCSKDMPTQVLSQLQQVCGNIMQSSNVNVMQSSKDSARMDRKGKHPRERG